ncbi:nucleolar transcription factor 1-like [Setaria italica]|uniref:nucleolar transcription factor 1-like n=1 Tax=Setaria italica TaxID=4555 RepID=UPI000BE56D31|nr:nucleolar transcription factor 1-like [Setaria italica]
MEAKEGYVEVDDDWVRQKAGLQAAIERVLKKLEGILEPETESSSSSDDDGSDDYTSDEEEDYDDNDISDCSSDEEDDGDDSDYSSSDEEEDDNDDGSDCSSDDEEEDDDDEDDSSYFSSDEEDDDEDSYSSSDEEEDCFAILGDCAMLGFNLITFVPRARAMQLIEDTRITVHAQCGPTVSCADILALATRRAVVRAGG